MKRLLLILLLSPCAFGQGFFASPQLALKTVNGETSPLANAVITVCAKNTSGIPCSPVLTNTIFSDSALTQALSNPFQADALGNFSFAAASAQYTVTVTGTGFAGISQQVNVGPSIISAGTFTNTQANLNIVSQIGGTTFAGTGLPNETDAFTGVTTLPVGATVHQGNGMSGVCYSNAVSSPLGTTANCVGLFGVGRASVNNSSAWGGNFGASDGAGTSGTLVIGHEVDLGLNGSPTRFEGFFVTGAPLLGTMPTGPVMGTLNVASNSASVYGVAFAGTTGTNPQFPVAYWSARGTAPVGLMLDATCYTGACNSQMIQMGANTGSAAATMTMQTFAGTPSGTCATNTLGFNASAATASTMLYVCVGGTSTWTAVTIP